MCVCVRGVHLTFLIAFLFVCLDLPALWFVLFSRFQHACFLALPESFFPFLFRLTVVAAYCSSFRAAAR